MGSQNYEFETPTYQFRCISPAFFGMVSRMSSASASSRPIRAILFDLGETLLEFGSVSVGAMFRAGAKLAHDHLCARGHRLPSFGRYYRMHWLAIRGHVIAAKLRGREFHSAPVLNRCCQRLGISLSPAELLDLCWQWYLPLSATATVEAGLAQLLASLRNQGYVLGIVSNTFVPGAVLDKHLDQLDLLAYFPETHRIYSSEFGLPKPNPAIYRHALAQIHTPAEETLFVGDHPKNDVLGPKRLGLTAALKCPARKFTARLARRTQPDYHIETLAELPAILATRPLPA